MENQDLNNNLNNPNLASQGPTLEPRLNPNNGGSTFKSLPRWIKIGVFILVLIVLFGGVYVLGRNSILKELNPTAPEIPSPGPLFQASPTPNPTAGWKTYSNTQYDFSFKYDSNYLKQGGSISGPSSPQNPLTTFGNIDPNSLGSDRGFDGFSIYVVPNTYKLSFSKFIEDEIIAFGKDFRSISVENKTNFSLGNLTNGAYLKDTNFDVNMYYFSFPDNKNFIVFGETNVTKDFKDQFKQILSTFKFAETSPTPTLKKEEKIFCTQDVKQCSDGSYVGRTGPNCEFVCPK